MGILITMGILGISARKSALASASAGAGVAAMAAMAEEAVAVAMAEEAMAVAVGDVEARFVWAFLHGPGPVDGFGQDGSTGVRHESTIPFVR